jgi:lysophospholipase L1-like esterase
MNMLVQRISQLLAVVASAIGCHIATAGDAVPADLEYLNFKTPNGEKVFQSNPFYPTARVWRYAHANDVEIHTTRRGVGPDSAMIVFTEKGENPGEELIYDIGVQGDDLKNYKGFSFWMRGDGGEGVLSIGTNWDQKIKSNAIIGTFPLAQKEWRKFFIPWDKFTPAVTEKGFYFFNLKVAPAKPRQAWAVVARPYLYKEEKTEAIFPVIGQDPSGMIPAVQFLQPGPGNIATMIPKTMAKLKAGQPTTIVAAGDSITAGSQLWYRKSSSKGAEREPDAFIYWAVLEQRLAEHYKYPKHRAVLKMWETVDKKTGKTLSGGSEDSFAIVTPGIELSPDGSAPFDGLQVIGVGAGGKNTQFGFERLVDCTQFKPDLVIWVYGANDLPSKNIKAYTEYTSKAIKALKSQGIEVMLCRPTFFIEEPYYTNSAAFGEPAMSMAKDLSVPLIDQFAAFNARGRRYVGDLLSDGVHPNEFGHQIMAATIASALGLPNQLVWDQGMFRAIQTGAKLP